MDLKLLEKLCNEFGTSGDEMRVRSIIKEEISKYVDEVFVDKFGNLIARNKGEKPRVMLAAHMDEIALIVKRITDKGKIIFSSIGGLDPISLIGQRVVVNGINGVIVNDDISVGDWVKSIPKLTEIYVDTGLTKGELLKNNINVGSLIYFEKNFKIVNGNFIISKALDNRIGCFILIELAKLLRKSKKIFDTFFVFTVQEEIGLYGAMTSAYNINPDWAIAVDVTSTDDAFPISTREIGKGPCITIKDALMIGNKCINDWLKKIAEDNSIPLQFDVSEYGATDALAISISRSGVPSTTISIPVRNIHTSYGLANLNDVKHCIELLRILMENPPLECLV